MYGDGYGGQAGGGACFVRAGNCFHGRGGAVGLDWGGAACGCGGVDQGGGYCAAGGCFDWEASGADFAGSDHADLLLAALPNQPFLSIEASAWFGTYRGGAREYYVDLFQALIGDVLLLEDFVIDGEEKRFFDDIVCPAFETASAILGRRPSIMQLCSNRRMASPLWYAYPASYRTHFQSLGCEI